MEKVLFAMLIILIILLIVVLSSRARIKKLYAKYLTVGNSAGLSGYQVGQIGKEKLELDWLSFATTKDSLGDAYSHASRTLYMTNAVCNYASLTSISVVSHELGHAVQDRKNDRLFGLIQILKRITHFTNHFIIPSSIIGLILFILGSFNLINSNWHTGGIILFYIGFGFFVFHALVKILTIPLEYNASKIGMQFLKDYQLVSKSEMRATKKLLNVAATTYIASLFDGIIGFGNKLSGLIHKKETKD